MTTKRTTERDGSHRRAVLGALVVILSLAWSAGCISPPGPRHEWPAKLVTICMTGPRPWVTESLLPAACRELDVAGVWLSSIDGIAPDLVIVRSRISDGDVDLEDVAELLRGVGR